MKKLFALLCIAFIIAIFPDHLLGQANNLGNDQHSSPMLSSSSSNNEIEHDEEGDEGKKPDRPDLAHEQEVQLTKDPRTGTVPKERLSTVFNLIKQQKSQRLSQAVKASATSANWVERGPSNVGGRTRALMYDPNDPSNKKVWAGGVGGGLWYTNDITVTSPVWINVDDFWANSAISCISYNPANTLELYVGTGEGWYNSDAIRGMGIWKSSDGGNTWIQLSSTNNSTFQQVQKIVITTSGIVYAATRSGGIRRSTNAGSSWTQVLGGRAADIEIGADGTLYGSIGIFSTDGIYSSTNGTTWIKRNTGSNGFPTSGIERIEIACAPSDANVLYALAQNNVDNGIENIYLSVDKGVSWTTVSKPTDADLGIGSDFTRGQGWYDLIAAVDPFNSSKLIVGGIDLFYSTNSGSSWTQISKWSNNALMNFLNCSLVHADQHAIVFQPGSSTVFLSGNDGGVYRCANVTTAGTSSQFSNKNSGYNVTQFYACAINPGVGSNNFIAGAQDNGTQKFTSSGMNTTTAPTGGDGAFCFIDQTNGNVQVSSYTRNTYYRTSNNWSTKSTISSSSTTGSFINPADYDDANGILYSAYSTTEIQRISNIRTSPSSPTQFTVSGMSSMATHLRVSPYSATGTTTLFVGTENSQLYKITNAHTATPTTTSIGSASFPSASISCIEIGATENNLIVTFTNYGVTSVWMTQNGGSTWLNKEGNLPDMPVRWALFNPNNLNEVLLATEVGVWSTSDISISSPVWMANNSGLSNVRVDMLQIRNSDKTIIAATHGRGLFSTDYLAAVSTDFSASTTSACAGNSIGFTDLTSNNPTSWVWQFPGGSPSTSTLQNPTVTYNNPGTYSVVLTSGNSSGTSSNTKTNYITIVASSTAGISITAAPSGTVCSGSNVYFEATPINGGSNPSFQWKVNGNNVGTNFFAYSSTVLNSGDQVSCVMTSNEVCPSGNPATSNTITMSVTTPVTPSVSISASPSDTVCSGTNVVFTAIPVNGGSTPSYQWKVNGTVVGLNNISYSSNSLSNTDQIVCELISSAFCPTTNPVTSNSIAMNVSTGPIAGVSISASPSIIICAGTNIDFTAFPINGGTTTSYQWKLNGTNVGNNSNIYSNSTLGDADQISCEMTSNEHCATNNPATSNILSINVSPNVNPGVSIAVSPATTVCAGTNVTFTASPVNGGTSPDFQWKLNGVNVGGNSANYSNNTIVNGSLVRCEMTSNYDCLINSNATSNTIRIFVNPSQTASVNISAIPNGICVGDSTVFTANPTNGGTAPVFQWKKNGINVGTDSVKYSDFSLIDGDEIKCEMLSNAGCVTGSPATSNLLTASNCSVNLFLKLYLEGYYLGGGFMRAVADPLNHPSITDTITVSLANSISPFSIFQSSVGTIGTSGIGSFNFTAIPPANYYIVINHRSSLESWSSTPVYSSQTMNYDFSTMASQAYGANLKDLGDGNFAIISGDIDQDGLVEMNDEMLLELSILNLTYGYVREDLNGDWISENSDYSIIENNIGIFSLQRP